MLIVRFFFGFVHVAFLCALLAGCAQSNLIPEPARSLDAGALDASALDASMTPPDRTDDAGFEREEDPPVWLWLSRTERINSVVDIDGATWVATSTGVAVLEAGREPRFLTPANSELPMIGVESIAGSPDGAIWFATILGVSRMLGDDWTHFSAEDIGVSSPTKLVVDVGGTLWLLGAQNELVTYDGSWRGVESASLPEGSFQLEAGAEGSVWLLVRPRTVDHFTENPRLVGGGLVRFKDDEQTVFTVENGFLTEAERDLLWLELDDRGRAYVAVNRGESLLVIEPDGSKRLLSVPLGSVDGRSYVVTGDGEIFVAFDDAIAHYDGDRWEMLGLPDEALTGTLRLFDASPDHHLWISIREPFDAGIDRLYSLEPRTSSEWVFHETSNSAIPTNRLREVAITPDDRAWFATPNRGLVSFDGESWTSWREETPIETVDVDPDGDLWFVTRDGRLGHYAEEATTERELPLNHRPSRFFELTLNSDCAGEHWIGAIGGSEGGLFHYDGRSWTFYDHEDLPNHSVRSIDCANDGVWVGTMYGNLAHFDGNRFRAFTDEEPNAPSDFILKVRADRVRGGAWVSDGTISSGGLSHFDGERWHRIDLSAFGDAPLYTYVISEDRAGDIVFIANGKLGRVLPGTHRAEIVSSPVPLYYANALEVDSRGNHFIGTDFGLVVFNPTGVRF